MNKIRANLDLNPISPGLSNKKTQLGVQLKSELYKIASNKMYHEEKLRKNTRRCSEKDIFVMGTLKLIVVIKNWIFFSSSLNLS